MENTAANDVKQIVVDNTNPTVSLTAPADNAAVRTSINLEAAPLDLGGTDSNIDKVEFYVDAVLVGTDTSSASGWRFSLDTTAYTDGNHTWFAKAFDKAGNNASSTSRTIKVDNTRPSVTINQAAGQADPTATSPINFTVVFSEPVTGFLTGNVSLGGTAGATTGAVTEIAPNDGTTYNVSVTGMTGNGTVIATIVPNRADDPAGNSNTASTSTDNTVTYVTDSTAPVVTVSFEAVDGLNGWYKHSPVTGSVTANDTTTGNSNISAINCTDSASGLTLGGLVGGGTTSASRTLSVTGQGTHNISCTATDSASNTGASAGSTTMPVVVKIDTVAPALSLLFTPDSPDGGNGWWKTPGGVPFAWTCSDGTSGIDSTFNSGCPSSMSGTVTAQGTTNFTDQVRDQAGNLSVTVNRDLLLDNEAPTLSLAFTPESPDGSNGWWKTPGGVPFLWTCSDSGSGIDAVYNGGCPAPLSGTENAQGTTNFAHAAVKDLAGNLSGAVNRDLKLDNVLPTLTVAFTPDSPDGNNGWWKTPGGVPFAWTCSDGTSGIDGTVSGGCPSPSSGTETAQGTTNFAHTVQDEAGNSASVNRNLLLDNVVPTLTLLFSPDSPDGDNGWWKTPGGVPFAWTCSDGTSGIDGTVNGGCPSPLSGTETAQGTTSFAHTVQDEAGNSASVNRSLMLDNVAPALSLAFTPDSPDGNNGWWKTPGGVPFAWTCSDGTSGVDPGYNGGCPAPPSGTETAQGTTNFAHAAVKDLAGNLSGAVNRDLKLDNVLPTLTLAFTPDSPDGNNGWWKTPGGVPFAWTCSDGTSGIDGTVNGGCPSPSSGTETAQGTTNFAHTVQDEAGNSASVNRNLMLDNIAPNITLNSAGDLCSLVGNAGWCRGTQTAGFAANDPGAPTTGSGLVGSSPFTQSTGTNGSAVMIPSGAVLDMAGNSNPGINAGPYKIDNVAPTINLVTPAEAANYVLNAAVASNYTCTDGTSGVGNCTGDVPNGSNFSTSPVGAHTFTVNSTDVAGNPATAVTHNYSVLYSTGACLGNLGHTILQPIDWTGTSVFKQKSTVPAKFRVCDANGASIGTPGVVTAFNIIQIIGGTVTDVNEPVDSTTPDTIFRWSPSDQQWIFNTNTKSLQAGKTYVFRINLNDTSTIVYQFGLK